MASYTVQVILTDSNYNSPSPQYSLGDVVSVHERIADKASTTGRLAFVHVNNVPGSINFKRLTSELSRPELSSVTIGDEIISKRIWKLDIESLDGYGILIASNELTVEWSDVLNKFIRKYDGKTGGEYYKELGL